MSSDSRATRYNSDDDVRPSSRSNQSKPLKNWISSPASPQALPRSTVSSSWSSRPSSSYRSSSSPSPPPRGSRPAPRISYDTLLPSQSSFSKLRSNNRASTSASTGGGRHLKHKVSSGTLRRVHRRVVQDEREDYDPILDQDPRFDEGCNWQVEEYSSSSPYSSAIESPDNSDSDDSDSSSDSDVPWVSGDFQFPKPPRKPPHMRKRVPLFPIATISRKRASFKEAHKRRFGLLFPIEDDTPEERHQVIAPTGKLVHFAELVTPVIGGPGARSIPRKISKAKRRRQAAAAAAAAATLAAASLSTSCPSCSHRSVSSISTIQSDIFTDDDHHSQSSSSSISSTPSLCESCASSPLASPTTKHCPLPSTADTLFTPVPERECPLASYIVSLEDEAQARARVKVSRKQLAEEVAFEASRKTMVAARDAAALSLPPPPPSTAVAPVITTSARPGIMAGLRDVLHSYLTSPPPCEALPTTPALCWDATGTALGDGYRVPSRLVAYAFPPRRDEEEGTIPCMGSIQFETLAPSYELHTPSSLRPRRAPSPSGSSSRSRSRLPRSGEGWDEEDVNSYDDDDDNEGEHRERHHHHIMPRAKPAIVEDSQFLQVYAIENRLRRSWGSSFGQGQACRLHRVVKFGKTSCQVGRRRCGGGERIKEGSMLRWEC